MRTTSLAAAFALVLLAPFQAQAADDKMLSPAECQPYGQTSTYETLALRADGVQNKTDNTNKYVICPINLDQESSWSEGVDGVDLIVYINRLGTGSISCTFTEGQDFSGLAPMTSTTVDATIAVGSVYVAEFNDIGNSSSLSGTITCRLPPKAKYLTTLVSESGPTDS